MARARNIKPGFFTNDALADISPVGRLLFIGLWCHADRAGRLSDRPRKIKAEVIPYDDCDVDALLGDLVKAGFILRYEADGARFIQVLNFTKHQNPHIKEPASEIPAPVEPCASTVQEPDSNSSGPADSLIPHPDSLNRIPDSLNHKSGAVAPAKVERGGYPSEFEDAWVAYPKRPGANKQSAYRAWEARIKKQIPPLLMLEGVRRYANYCVVCGTEPRFIKQPATFFGPDEHFRSDWTPPVQGAPPTSSGRRVSAVENYAAQAAQARGDHGKPTDERTIEGTATVVA